MTVYMLISGFLLAAGMALVAWDLHRIDSRKHREARARRAGIRLHLGDPATIRGHFIRFRNGAPHVR